METMETPPMIWMRLLLSTLVNRGKQPRIMQNHYQHHHHSRSFSWSANPTWRATDTCKPGKRARESFATGPSSGWWKPFRRPTANSKTQLVAGPSERTSGFPTTSSLATTSDRHTTGLENSRPDSGEEPSARRTRLDRSWALAGPSATLSGAKTTTVAITTVAITTVTTTTITTTTITTFCSSRQPGAAKAWRWTFGPRRRAGPPVCTTRP
mmetsp:Transcript_22143/g.61630  ORF Transcript_22143/g.61630 Transcript_22143/m.61630 type:complete len:211 (+) Transcript_22143:271-903(+)